jgi:hypothetical protein
MPNEMIPAETESIPPARSAAHVISCVTQVCLVAVALSLNLDQTCQISALGNDNLDDSHRLD